MRDDVADPGGTYGRPEQARRAPICGLSNSLMRPRCSISWSAFRRCSETDRFAEHRRDRALPVVEGDRQSHHDRDRLAVATAGVAKSVVEQSQR
jgi:hypothetical protein